MSALIPYLTDTTDHINLVSKTLDDATRHPDGRNSLRRLLLSRGGSDVKELDVDTVLSPSRRPRMLGIGKALQALFVLSGGDINKAGWDTSTDGPVSKALDAAGIQHVSKTPLATTTGATGGYAVPIEMHRELLRLTAEESFLQPRCTYIPMPSPRVSVPSLNHAGGKPGASPFHGGLAPSFQGEGVTIAEADVGLREVTLQARNMQFSVVASNQLLQNNAVALDMVLTTIFRDTIAWSYDYYILRGNGANQPLGALNAPCTIAVDRTAADTITFDDVAAMYRHLLPQSEKSAIWVANPSTKAQLIRMTNGATNAPFLVWLNPAPAQGGGPASAQLPMTFFGLPLFFSEKLPALGQRGDIVLIDPSKMLFGDLRNLIIDSSPWTYFTSNQTVWRVIAQWDAQPWLHAPITLPDGDFQVSPFIVLE